MQGGSDEPQPLSKKRFKSYTAPVLRCNLDDPALVEVPIGLSKTGTVKKIRRYNSNKTAAALRRDPCNTMGDAAKKIKLCSDALDACNKSNFGHVQSGIRKKKKRG